jgi:hypothetical protein
LSQVSLTLSNRHDLANNSFLEIIAHNRARRHVSSHNLEPCPLERRNIPGVRCARRQLRIERIRFESRSTRPPCHLQRRRDQCGRNTLFAIPLANIKTRERPHRHLVHALEPPRTIKPRQGIAWRKLAPPHRQFILEGEQPRRWPALYQLTQRRPILITRPLAILVADPPIHTPAPADSPLLPEQVFECRPQLGCEGVHSEFHVIFLTIHEKTGRISLSPPTNRSYRDLLYSNFAR